MRKIAMYLLVLLSLPIAAPAQVFVARLLGANEFPGPGDPNGTGLMVMRIEGTTIHYTIFVKDISPNITGAHIHPGAAGTEGGVLVGFNPVFNANGVAVGTISGVPSNQIAQIMANPSGHYFNVHTNEFGRGAIRGQLETGCATDQDTLCLSRNPTNRFRVEADWETRGENAQIGTGKAVKLTDDSGYFWFFNAENVELIVKVLRACFDPFNTQWVFAAGLTDVEVDLYVVDMQTGAVRRYSNPQQNPFPPIQDTSAFACP